MTTQRRSVFGLALYTVATFTTAADFVSPLQKWRQSAGSSYGVNAQTPTIDPNLLPQLQGGNEVVDGVYEGLKAGEFELKIDGATLLVDQETEKVLAVWDSFNIGENAKVKFDQPSVTAVAVNMIDDQSPSAILGSLESNGQLYLLNPNGILFGENAQVDTRGLIAAAMELEGYDIDHTFASEADKQAFLDNSLLEGIKDGKAFLVNAKDLVDGTQDLPRIVIKEGASLSSGEAPMLLAGPQVINEGTLQSDQGQVVLAGTRKELYLAVSDNDADLRGFLVEVNSGDDTERGSVVNAGSIISNLGNVTLVASDILQAGSITATTSVDTNGSIRIIARDQAQVFNRNQLPAGAAQLDALYFDGVGVQGEAGKTGQTTGEIPSVGAVAVGTESGSVVFAADSVTQVRPQSLKPGVIKAGFEQLDKADRNALHVLDFWHSSEERQIELLKGYGVEVDSNNIAKATDSLDQRLIPSTIIVEAKDIELERRAKIYAPSGRIDIAAKDRPLGITRNTNSTASLMIGEDVVIDASGTTNEVLGSDRNSVGVFITSSEVSDTPFQKGGELLRKEVLVDVIEGTDLFDWEPSLDAIEKTVYERMTEGGSINLYAEGHMAIEDNATLDASGGFYQVAAGEVISSKVVTPSGLVSLAKAGPDATILDVIDLGTNSANHSKWGARNSFNPMAPFLGINRAFRDRYTVGADAGSIGLNSRDFDLGSVDIRLDAKNGEYQRLNPVSAGTLLIESRVAPAPRNFVVADSAFLQSIDQGLGEDVNNVYLNQSIFEDSGAKRIELDTFGNIELRGQDELALADGTELSLSAHYIEINSDVRSAGGDFIVETTPSANSNPDLLSGTRINANIDVSGKWVNDFLQYEDNKTQTLEIDAGNILLNSQLSFGDEAALVADGGAWLSNEKDLVLGSAGVVSLGKAVVQDTELVLHQTDVEVSLLDGKSGGLLRVFDDAIAIRSNSGGFERSEQFTEVITTDELASDRVNNYEFIARNGSLLIDADEDVVFDAVQYDVSDLDSLALKGNSDSLRSVTTSRKPFDHELTPLTVQFRAFSSGSSGAKANAGTLEVTDNSRVISNPGSFIGLSASGKLIHRGEIKALSGDVRYELSALLVDGAKESGADEVGTKSAGRNSNIIDLSGSTTNVSSYVYDLPNNSYLGSNKAGLDAGSIRVVAEKGFINADDSSLFQLSGATYQENIRLGPELTTQSRFTDAGVMEFTAEAGMAIDSTIDFGDLEETAKGGSLKVELNPNTFARDEFDLVESRVLHLGGAFDSALEGQGLNAIVKDENMNDGFVSGSVLATDNIHVLDLGVMNTEGSIDLPEDQRVAVGQIKTAADVSLDVAGGVRLSSNELALDNHALEISAPYVEIGRNSLGNSQFQQPQDLTATDGLGVVIVDAAHIDLVGNFATKGVNNLLLNAKEGLRFNSTVDSDNSITSSTWATAADIVIDSPRVWGGSLADFTLETSENIVLQSDGQRANSATPLSAGADVVLKAENIVIGSQLLAPHGRIELDAENEIRLTPDAFISVSGDRAVPLGLAQAGDFSWGYSVLGGTPFRFDGEQGFPLDRNVVFSSSIFDSQDGSIIDVSAGGQVFAREFVPGIEGTIDRLSNASAQDVFALVPGEMSGFAPRDNAEIMGTGISPGQQIELRDNGLVPDGVYTVLPASYALVDGAILVEATGFDANPSSTGFVDGNMDQQVVGRFVERGARGDLDWQYFKLYDSERTRIFGDYDIVNSDQFLQTSDYLAQPGNNGGVSFNIAEQIALDGNVLSSGDSPLSSFIDITSSSTIRIGSDIQASSSELVLDDSIFEAAAGSSILIGAIRTLKGEGIALQDDSIAPEVIFDSAEVRSDDLIITAQDGIILRNNSLVSDSTSNSTHVDAGSTELELSEGVGALLAFTSGQLNFSGVENLENLSGISVDESSQLEVNRSLSLIDDGSLALENGVLDISEGGSLNLVRPDIVVGSLNNASLGANVDSSLLQNVSELNLTGMSKISFAEDLVLNVDRLNLQTEQLEVQNAAKAELVSESVLTIGGTSKSSLIGNEIIGGELKLQAGEIQIAGGDQETFLVLNAGKVDLNATKAISYKGESSLSVSGDLNLVANTLYGSENLSILSVYANGSANFSANQSSDDNNNSGSSVPEDAGIGTGLVLSGETLTIASTLWLPAGQVSLESTQGNVEFEDSARLLLGGLELGQLAPELNSVPARLTVDAADSIVIDNLGSIDFSSDVPVKADVNLVATDAVRVSFDDSSELDFGQASNLSVDAVDLWVNDSSAVNDGLLGFSVMNQAGFDGHLRLRFTADQDLDVAGNLSAQTLNIEQVNAGLSVSGSLFAEEQLTLSALNNIALNAGSQVKVGESGAELNLNSAEGSVQIDALAELDSSVLRASLKADSQVVAGLDLSLGQHSQVDSIEILLRAQRETETLTEAQLDADIAQANATVASFENDVRAGIEARSSSIKVAPHLLYHSDENITVAQSASGNILEFDELRGADLPGLLEIRAKGNVELEASLSAGVINPVIDFASPVAIEYELENTANPTQFLNRTWMHSDQNSPSLVLTAGAVNPLVSKGLDVRSDAQLRFAEEQFVQTGTGDLALFSAADLVLNRGAYTATLGKSVASDANVIPLMGDLEYLKFNPVTFGFDEPITGLLFDRFSGFSTDAGDIEVYAGRDILGQSNELASTHLISIDIPSDEVFSGLIYEDTQAQFAVLDELVSGIHSVGGGSVSVSSERDIHALSVSSAYTGYQIGQTVDVSDLDQTFSQGGGTISLSSAEQLAGVSVFGGGGDIALTAGRVVNSDQDGLAGSGFARLNVAQRNGGVSVQSLGDLSVDSIFNSAVALYRESPFYVNANQNLESVASFDAYGSASVNLQSIAGDIHLTRDFEVIRGLYSGSYGDLFRDQEQLSRYLTTHDVLPSETVFSSYNGDILINGNSNNGNVLSVFPSVNASLDWYAYGDIYATGLDGAVRGERVSNMTKVQIPDFFERDALSKELGLSYREVPDFMVSSPVFAPATTEQQWIQNHSAQLVDRGDKVSSIRAETGSIGSETAVLGFNSPMPVQVRSGGSIINTGFVIQHSNEQQISSIVAAEDFVYPFFRNEFGALIPSANQELGIRIGGPGALILNAGGSIDLGTSRGVVSRGALDNPNLPRVGADLVLAAGYVMPTSYDLAGSAEIDVFADAFEQLGLSPSSSSALDLLKVLMANQKSEGLTTVTDLAEERLSALEQTGGKGVREQDIFERIGALDEDVQGALVNDLLYQSLLSTRSLAQQTSGSQFVEKSREFSTHYWEQLWRFKLLSEITSNPVLKENLEVLKQEGFGFSEVLKLLPQAFDNLSPEQQFLLAHEFMIDNNLASGQEALTGSLSFEAFDRGYIGQAKVLGEDYQAAVNAITLRGELLDLEKTAPTAFNELLGAANDFEAGLIGREEFSELTKKHLNAASLGLDLAMLADYSQSVAATDDILISESGESLTQVLQNWGSQNQINLAPNVSSQTGDINLLYTTVQTRRGGNISLFAPAGNIDVGQSAAQVESLFVANAPTEERLGLLGFEQGNIAAISAGEFNVNESRVIPLAGGDVSLWSMSAGIDAGRGAKTAIATPPARYQVSSETGLVTKLAAPAVSGSGISTRKVETILGAELSESSAIERYLSLRNQGAAGAFLSTPLGIVDAGEAGIQTAGDLFIAAQEVVGADNISAGGISTGVPVTTSISSDIGGLGSAIDAATSAVQESAENSATEAANQRAAFVTIELL